MVGPPSPTTAVPVTTGEPAVTRSTHIAPRESPLITRAEARRRLAELGQSKGDTEYAMHDLVSQWSSAFRPPWVVHPVLHRVSGGYVYIRWRLAGVNGRQPFVDPAGDSGKALLSSVSTALAAVLRDYWRATLDLNVAYSVAHGEWQRWERYLCDREQLDVQA